MFYRCANKVQEGEVLLKCPEVFEDIFVPHHPKFASIFGEGYSDSPRRDVECVTPNYCQAPVAICETPSIVVRRSISGSITPHKTPSEKNSDVTAFSPTISTTTGGRTTGDLVHNSTGRTQIDLSDLVISATARSGEQWASPSPRQLGSSHSTIDMSDLNLGGDRSSSTDEVSSVDYLPTRGSPVMNLRVPKLNLHSLKHQRKRNRPKQLLAMDVANLLTNNTFAVSESMQGSVQFQTIKPGAAAPRLHFNAQATCRAKNSEAHDRRKPKGVSFTGPGFALLPQSKGSDIASSESVPIYNRRSTVVPSDNVTIDSPRSFRTRDYVNPFDENHLAGMFKSKKDLRRKTFFDEGHESQKSLSVECKEEISPVILAVVKRDVSRIKQACESNDVDALIDLLDCITRLPPELAIVQQSHAWCTVPESINALAACELSVLASIQKFTPEQIEKICLRMKPLLMDTARIDETEGALLALNYISGHAANSALTLYENGYLPILIKLMHKEKEGIQAAAARLCRDIFVLRPEWRVEFRNLGGMHGILSLLKPDRSYDLQMEALYYLEDLILHNGEEIPEFIESVKVLSIGNLLEKLLDVPDPSLASVAKQIYLRIAD